MAEVENTVGKGEIAHNEQFLLFPQCFQKACFPGVSKGVIVWEWVNSSPNHKKRAANSSSCALHYVIFQHSRIQNLEMF